MKYLTVEELSHKWHISQKRIEKLCCDGQIEGVMVIGHSWLIPDTVYNVDFDVDIIVKEDFEQIIKDYGQYIYNFAYKLSVDPQDAKDISQNTFIKAWQHLDSLNNSYAIKKWLRMICLNEFRMKLKKQKRIKIDYLENIEDLEKDSRYLMTPKPDFINEVAVSDEVAKLRDGCFLAMTRKLTINQRLALSLIDMFGLSINEVALILDTTPKAVKGLLYRARMNLEAFFKDHCSILDINNSCQCLAWKDFVQNRAKMQEELKHKLEVLNYKNTSYQYDMNTRKKILYYYQNIPEYKPHKEWFLELITLLEDFFENNSSKP